MNRVGSLLFLTPQEAAETMHVSIKTIRRRISDGTLPATRVGRLIRIRQADLYTAFDAVPHAQIGVR